MSGKVSEKRITLTPAQADEAVSAQHIMDALCLTSGNKTRAAYILSVSRQYLVSRLMRAPEIARLAQLAVRDKIETQIEMAREIVDKELADGNVKVAMTIMIRSKQWVLDTHIDPGRQDSFPEADKVEEIGKTKNQIQWENLLETAPRNKDNAIEIGAEELNEVC